MAKTIEQRLEDLKTGFAAHLLAQGATALVTREWRNHDQLNCTDLEPGRWTIIATGGQGFDAARDLDEAFRGGRQLLAMVYQVQLPESSSALDIEQKVTAAFEHLASWIQHSACCLYLSSYSRDNQLEHPYGWLGANLYFTE